jgi:hypothetical protein
MQRLTIVGNLCSTVLIFVINNVILDDQITAPVDLCGSSWSVCRYTTTITWGTFSFISKDNLYLKILWVIRVLEEKNTIEFVHVRSYTLRMQKEKKLQPRGIR